MKENHVLRTKEANCSFVNSISNSLAISRKSSLWYLRYHMSEASVTPFLILQPINARACKVGNLYKT